MVGLDEPPVVPNFLEELERKGWVSVKVSVYETRWARRECGREVVERCERGELGVVVFTSTAEVDGLLKSLKELFELRRWPPASSICVGQRGEEGEGGFVFVSEDGEAE
ncbi:Tetrapyrrole biosynthesis, uroporphyrinogen III synthase [Fagus crenata]